MLDMLYTHNTGISNHIQVGHAPCISSLQQCMPAYMPTKSQVTSSMHHKALAITHIAMLAS